MTHPHPPLSIDPVDSTASIGSMGSKHERGMALLISVFVLMLVGLVAVSSLQNSEDESTAGGRTRSAVRSLYEADSGIQIAMNRLTQIPLPADFDRPINFNLGGDHSVQSKTWGDATPQNIKFAGNGQTRDGMQLMSGLSGGGTTFSAVYQVNMTAVHGTRSVAEVEARLSTFAVIQ